jgi:hypothetical protein
MSLGGREQEESSGVMGVPIDPALRLRLQESRLLDWRSASA